MEDPFLPLRDMTIQFIKHSDISSLNESMNLFLKKSIQFIEELSKVEKTDNWKPEDVLLKEFTFNFIDNQKILLEIASRESLDVSKKIILKVSSDFCIELIKKKYFVELKYFFKYWKDTADNSMGISSSIFKEILNYYYIVANLMFDNLHEDFLKKQDIVQKILEDIFIDIGWLGERLLIRVPLEASPIMRNYSYSSEFDDLYEFLFSFSDRYDTEFPNAYPYMFFNAIDVVLRRLILILQQNYDSDIKNKICLLSYAYTSFAESALEENNSNGAALAVTRVQETYIKLKDCGFDDIAKEIIITLVKIGILAKEHQESLEIVEFIGIPLDSWIINKLIESGEDITAQVRDDYIGTLSLASKETRLNFIIELGVGLGTNFGFMFDPITGEKYPEDDPKRRC